MVGWGSGAKGREFDGLEFRGQVRGVQGPGQGLRGESLVGWSSGARSGEFRGQVRGQGEEGLVGLGVGGVAVCTCSHIA